MMYVFILEAIVFIPGFIILVVGKIPLTRRRAVNDAAARIIGVILMLPLALYLIACRSLHIPPLATKEDIELIMDPLMPYTVGYLQIGAVAATLFCLVMAGILAFSASEIKRRP
jgi:EamA domain-containing membrane protein RarD